MYKTFIYTLASSKNPNDIRYVGKTTQTLKRRLQGHLCDAKKSKKRKTNRYSLNWINKEIDEGYEIIIEELDLIISENKNE